MTTRREILLALSACTLCAALPALAQQPAPARRIGFFSGSSEQAMAPNLAAFREGMTELRWVYGRDYLIDARFANGVAQAGPGLAAELVASRPDLLLTPADPGTRMLAQITKTIPIVFTSAQDPVGNGVAASLRRPGGNATGLTNIARELGPKRLQLLKEAFPRVAHVALLFEPSDLGSVSQAKEIQAAAARLGVRVSPIELRQVADIDAAFKRGAALRAQAYVVLTGFFINSQQKAVADGVLRARIPAMFGTTAFVEAGGLMSYAPSSQDQFRRTAGYADKILKGAKPGDLPIEQPTRFELLINMKTAKAMGLTIPQSILLRADRVIE